jgi:hypothetical protein
MVMTQSSSLTKVATLIAKVNQEPENQEQVGREKLLALKLIQLNALF